MSGDPVPYNDHFGYLKTPEQYRPYRFEEAVEIVYSAACVAGLQAMRANATEDVKKWYEFAGIIEDLYPVIVQSIRDRTAK